MVKNSNMAHKLSDELVDWLKDEEIQVFIEHLKRFGLTQRKGDYFWEAAR